jgi:hypothetical protein
MSSMFEAPPQRRSSWLKVVTAFVAGAVVALAIGQVPTILYGSGQPAASARVPAANVPPSVGAASTASKPAVVGPSKAVGDAPENTPAPAAEARSAPAQAATAAAAAEGGVKSCTWPYVDQRCAEADTNSGQATQSVRVIPTDRSAPPTAAATIAPSEPTQTGGVAAAAPAATAPADPTAVAAQPVPPIVPQAAAERGPTEPNSGVRKPARSKDAKATGTGKREARRAKSSEQQSRAVRSRTLDSDDAATEFADSALIRTHILPDGRRVSVYRELNARDDGRPVARRDYRVRRVPAPRPYEDDDDED